MSKKIFNISTLAILIIGAVVASYVYKNLSSRPNYLELKVKKGNIQATLDINGKVVPQDSAGLGFEIGGKVTSLTHQVGDFVPAGTILANTESIDLTAAYRQAQALVQGAQANVDQYQALVKKAKEQLDSLKKNDANSSDKDAQRAQIKASEAQVEAQEANVAAALASVQIAKAQLNKTVITAPFDGVISKQDIKIGETTDSNAPVITLMSKDAFKVEVFVSQIDVRGLHAGDSAQIALDDNPEKKYTARITSIDPTETTINNSSNYKVTFNFIEAVSNLRPGVGANASVAGLTKDNIIDVPKDAILESGGQKFVYVSENGLRKQREIQTGIYGGDNRVEITAGLSAGDTIFILSK
jgi:RND family efflux transporter MFP subunit